ncbi:hypothetical protein [Hydrogenophaga sp. RWCD_12]|uniref:hypothetical protein n=1 Tax=Hydrogenophaga sp. RWCD_12 TaxID=3391190 RepID=UPI00398479F9
MAYVQAASAAASPLESGLSDLISLSRQRRVLVAARDVDVGELARLDALLRQSLGALRRQSDSLPASIALDVSALNTDWQVLESAHPGLQSTPFARFAQHSQFIDNQLALLSHVREVGL